jgi:hypothetical protein
MSIIYTIPGLRPIDIAWAAEELVESTPPGVAYRDHFPTQVKSLVLSCFRAKGPYAVDVIEAAIINAAWEIVK